MPSMSPSLLSSCGFTDKKSSTPTILGISRRRLSLSSSFSAPLTSCHFCVTLPVSLSLDMEGHGSGGGRGMAALGVSRRFWSGAMVWACFVHVLVAAAEGAGKDSSPESPLTARFTVTTPLPLAPTKRQWLRFLRVFKLHPPKCQEGWRFSRVVWRRWRGILRSRGGLQRWRVLTLTATAYCPRDCCGTGTGRTATGRKAEYGIVAVDPHFIPLGTVLYIDGYGFALAADTGSKIKGWRIDLCYPTHRQALRFGRRKVRVLLLHRGRERHTDAKGDTSR